MGKFKLSDKYGRTKGFIITNPKEIETRKGVHETRNDVYEPRNSVKQKETKAALRDGIKSTKEEVSINLNGVRNDMSNMESILNLSC